MCAAEPVICIPVQEFEPRQSTGQEGILIAGRGGLRRSADDLRAVAERPVTDLVCRITQWGEPDVLADRVGDFRFLILEFTRPDGVTTYVQTRSEPTKELIMEVGPGKRPDALRQAFADSVAEHLARRGFAIGGNADNFRKRSPVPKAEDPLGIAKEMLAILTDVLGYDGSTDLTFSVQQGTYFSAAYVMYGIARSGLQAHLRVWGLQATAPPDDPTVLDARSHGIDFRMYLLVPKKNAPHSYWEVHCRTRLPFPRERVADLLNEVNNKPWLVKAWPLDDSSEETVSVALGYGFNLAGGVTPDHLKSQLFEWLENVRQVWSDWGRLSASPVETARRSGEPLH